MDFRQVVKEHRRFALAVQFLLALSILAYRAYSIFASADAPPVEASLEVCKNFGEWAFCHQDPAGAMPDIAGLACYDSYNGDEIISP